MEVKVFYNTYYFVLETTEEKPNRSITSLKFQTRLTRLSLIQITLQYRARFLQQANRYRFTHL